MCLFIILTKFLKIKKTISRKIHKIVNDVKYKRYIMISGWLNIFLFRFLNFGCIIFVIG